jgi:hypothetical protein
VASAPEDPPVASADAKREDIARAIQQLSPEEAAHFLFRVEMALRKRKIQLTGYFVALLVWLLGTLLALAYYGTHDGFVSWVFLAPFGLVGVVLWLFGGWAEHVGRRTLPRDPPAAPGS